MRRAELAGLLLLGCTAPCPSGLHEDAARAAQLRSLLAGVPEAAPLLSDAPPVCFGQAGEGVLGEDGVMRLSGEGELRAEAARMAHLLQHHQEGPPLAPPDGRPCAARVAAAMAAEAEAYALEGRTRRALGLAGEPVMGEGLEADYRRRCVE